MKLANTLKIARNSFLYASVICIWFGVFYGLLMTNDEIKTTAELAMLSASIASIIHLIRLTVLKWFNAPKRGVTFNK